MPTVPEARYNPEKVCIENTRVGILHDITTWISSPVPPHVASLRGKAGIGKSTIAHTVASKCSESACLGASYFFGRDLASARPLANLVPELARQLAFRIPSFRRALCDTLERDDLSVYPLQQLRTLLTAPLHACFVGGHNVLPWVIVIDALDECEDDIRSFILQFCKSVAEFDGKIKLVITSRPEAAIDAVQELRDIHLLHIDITGLENERDIHTYFDFRMVDLRTKDGWPVKDPVKRLVQLAGGLFIWAAIVISFLLESDSFAEEIALILSETLWEDSPEKRLSQMYNIILDKAFMAGTRTHHKQHFLPILSTVMLVSEPQPEAVIQRLAADSLRIESLRKILGGLSAALHIPPESPVVRVIHPSFYRHLTLDCHDSRFSIDIPTQARDLGLRCLALMSQELHYDICNISAYSDLPQADIPHFCDIVNQAVALDLRYACQNFVKHLAQGVLDMRTRLRLEEFFKDTFLPWVEVMVLLGLVNSAQDALQLLRTWLEASPSLYLPSV